MDFNDSSEDVFGDLNYQNNTTYERPSHVLIVLDIILSLLDFLIGLSSVLANLLVIYVITKFNKLKTQVNHIILNFSLCHLMFMLVEPIFGLIHALLLDGYINFSWYCTVFLMEESCLLMHYVFAGLLGVDVFLRTYHTNLAVKYQQYFKIVIASVYSLGFLYVLSESIVCFLGKSQHFRATSLLVTFCVVAMVIIFVRVTVAVNSKKGRPPPVAANFSLAVCVWFLAFWMPVCVLHVLVNFLEYYLVFLARMFAYCNPIFNVFLYAKHNKNFKVAYYKVFRRQIQNYDNDFEDEVPPEYENNVSTVQIVQNGDNNEIAQNGVSQNHQ